MRRKFAIVLGALAAAALFGALVHSVLVAAHLSEPAANTVQGLTVPRLWATATAALALAGVFIGAMAVRRSAGRSGSGSARVGAMTALAAGLVAVASGGLNLAIATGGPGSGNGVVGAAAALVLGLVAMALGCIARGRVRSAAES